MSLGSIAGKPDPLSENAFWLFLKEQVMKTSIVSSTALKSELPIIAIFLFYPINNGEMQLAYK